LKTCEGDHSERKYLGRREAIREKIQTNVGTVADIPLPVSTQPTPKRGVGSRFSFPGGASRPERKKGTISALACSGKEHAEAALNSV